MLRVVERTTRTVRHADEEVTVVCEALRRQGSVPTGPLDRVLLDAAERVADHSCLNTGAVLRVTGSAPAVDTVRRVVADGVARAPALAYRLGTDRTNWEPDPGFDPAAHVEERRLDAGADPLAEVLRVAARPFSYERPLWRLVMLHGHAPDEYALFFCFHHAFQDGQALAATLEAVFADRALPHPTEVRDAAPVRPWFWPAPTDLGLPSRRTAGWVPRDRGLTGRFRLLSGELDGEALRATARVAGVTRNQVSLAALSMALRAWTPDNWTGPPGRRTRPDLTVAVPLALRDENAAGLGNRVGVLSVHLPWHLPSPVRQLQRVAAQTSSRRVLRHREMKRALMARLPEGATRALYRRYADPRYTAMYVSAVRMRPLRVAGAAVHDALALPLRPAVRPAAVTLVQYGDRVMPCIRMDDAVENPGRLLELWQESVSRLHDLTGAAHG